MGYDTSFHPVDVQLVQERLLPFVAGRGADDDLDDLIRRAVALRRVRFRAKSWALGTIGAARQLGIDAVQPSIHVWGRPFFIVGDDPSRVAEDVVRYQATDLDQVDDLAREMLGRLHPALVEAAQPDTSGQLPDDASVARSLTWALRLLRDASIALRAGRPLVREPGGTREHDPAALLARELPLQVLEFASALTPGWMSRGYTWPTTLCAWAGVEAGFGPPDPLIDPLRAEFPDLKWLRAPTIVENYMVGGYVAPAGVTATRATLTAALPALLAGAERKAGPSSWDVELLKIDEALALAERLGFGFCEATEVYSGMDGNLN